MDGLLIGGDSLILESFNQIILYSSIENYMKKATAITHMFLDIGGVLLTNGWDHYARGSRWVSYIDCVIPGLWIAVAST